MLAACKPVVMPCFTFISGHLSRAHVDGRRARALCQLFAAFLIFQCLYHVQTMLAFRLNGFPFQGLPLQLFQPQQQASSPRRARARTPPPRLSARSAPSPQVVTWFLLALLIWRASLPLLASMRQPLLVALAIGLGSLYVDLSVNYQNIASFLPYFVAGHLAPPRVWSALAQPRLRIPLAALFVLSSAFLIGFSAVGGAAFSSSFDAVALTYDCFNGAPPDARAHECPTGRELLRRALFYAASVPLVAGFLAALPRSKGLWTHPGYMSM